MANRTWSAYSPDCCPACLSNEHMQFVETDGVIDWWHCYDCGEDWTEGEDYSEEMDDMIDRGHMLSGYES